MLELAACSTRLADPPGHLELALLSAWLELCMGRVSVGSRNRCLVLWGKVLLRIRAAVAAILAR